MTCSIIIRSYNEERHIGHLLDGIKQQNKANDIEIILVDSGSEDATVTIALEAGVRIIHIDPSDFSFGKSLNLGCGIATGEILLFASAHVYPIYNNWIENMLKHFEDSNVGLVYGRQTGNEVTKFSEQQVFKKWFPEQSNLNQHTPFCNNANCAVRRSLWQKQPFDDYLTGLEDLDWANKIMSSGYKIIYDAEAVIVHVHEETFQKIKNRYQREAIALKHIFPEVRFNMWDFLWLLLSNVFLDMLHALQQRKFLKESKQIVAFRFIQFWGTYSGHLQKGKISTDLKNKFYYPGGFRFNKKQKPNSDKNNIIEYKYG